MIKPIDILNKVDDCTTEAEMAEVSAMAEEAVQAGFISNTAHDIIKWALEKRLSYLEADGIIKEV